MDFVLWLERRGATFNFRRADTTDWHLNLDEVVDMAKDEAAEIAAAALEIRDAIREVPVRRAHSMVH